MKKSRCEKQRLNIYRYTVKRYYKISSLIKVFIIFCLPNTHSKSFSSKTSETWGLVIVKAPRSRPTTRQLHLLRKSAAFSEVPKIGECLSMVIARERNCCSGLFWWLSSMNSRRLCGKSQRSRPKLRCLTAASKTCSWLAVPMSSSLSPFSTICSPPGISTVRLLPKSCRTLQP